MRKYEEIKFGYDWSTTENRKCVNGKLQHLQKVRVVELDMILLSYEKCWSLNFLVLSVPILVICTCIQFCFDS